MRESREAEEVRERMEEVRRDLGVNVHELVENVRVRSDWHYYFQKYPWVVLGTAVAAGYLLVPRRSPPVAPDVKSVLDLIRHPDLLVKSPPPEPRSSLLSKVVSAGSGLVLRGLMTYATQQAGRMFNSTPEPSTENGHGGGYSNGAGLR